MLEPMPFHIVLYQPEIPPNTGNIVRLAANTGARLHLVRPLGFSLSERSLRRAGLDYHEIASLQVHDNWPDCRAVLAGSRLFAVTSKGEQRYDQPTFEPGDAFLFGAESRGLPPEILAEIESKQRLRLPMVAGNRSLNLANAVSILIYEAWRQASYVGA
jgi:tRNA (cytidine/uridine-2'-O-)-methyltransferase